MAINLLPGKVRAEKKGKAVKQASVVGALVLVIGIGAISAGVFVFKMVLNREIGFLENQIEDQRKKIMAQEHVELKARSLEAKTVALEKLLGDVEYYSVLLEGLTSAIPAEIALTSLRVDSPTLVGVSGTAVSYVDLARFLKAVGSTEEVVAKAAELFSGVRLKSVSLDTQTGQVKFSLDLVVGKEALRGDKFQ